MISMTNTLLTRRGGSKDPDARRAAQEFHAAVVQPGMRFVLFYCAPEYDLEVLGAELARLFEGVEVLGCTTAGEIGPLGYINGSIGGVSIASTDFALATRRLDELRQFEFSQGLAVGPALQAELRAQGISPDPENSFAFLLVDGMCMKEEPVVSAIYRGLGDIQLFGGSAGDGTRFQRTHIFHEGRFRTECAVVALIHTKHPFCVFKTQHFISNEERMVVTSADPARRVVTEINGEPAGLEYARLVGLAVDKLTPLIFAAHPVVVRLGGLEYVRSIQKVNEDGSLTFFCAIDEGIVLTVARGVDLVHNLEETFAYVKQRVGTPELVLGCDCILRHVEIEQKGLRGQVSDILLQNGVIGFSTYGEQYNAMHVNQTFTGVAIGAAPNV
jgi:hypothetical protein